MCFVFVIKADGWCVGKGNEMSFVFGKKPLKFKRGSSVNREFEAAFANTWKAAKPRQLVSSSPKVMSHAEYYALKSGRIS